MLRCGNSEQVSAQVQVTGPDFNSLPASAARFLLPKAPLESILTAQPPRIWFAGQMLRTQVRLVPLATAKPTRLPPPKSDVRCICGQRTAEASFMERLRRSIPRKRLRG